MKKALKNYIVFVILALLFMFQVISGFVMWFGLPKKSGGELFLGLNRTGWLDIHNVVSVLMILVILYHVLIHWKWIVYNTKVLLKK